MKYDIEEELKKQRRVDNVMFLFLAVAILFVEVGSRIFGEF
jgi:hypothetical protein